MQFVMVLFPRRSGGGGGLAWARDVVGGRCVGGVRGIWLARMGALGWRVLAVWRERGGGR